jgi:hypothetical protein
VTISVSNQKTLPSTILVARSISHDNTIQVNVLAGNGQHIFFWVNLFTTSRGLVEGRSINPIRVCEYGVVSERQPVFAFDVVVSVGNLSQTRVAFSNWAQASDGNASRQDFRNIELPKRLTSFATTDCREESITSRGLVRRDSHAGKPLNDWQAGGGNKRKTFNGNDALGYPIRLRLNKSTRPCTSGYHCQLRKPVESATIMSAADEVH